VLIEAEYAELDKELLVEIRGKKIKAKIVPVPFYKRAKK
jgi:aminomethyltransferase